MIRAVPIYDYRCDACGHAFSAVQSYTDATLEICPQCGAKPRKLLTSPAIVFKGSGWYKTDSRRGSDAAKADAKAEGKTDAKPETATEKGPKPAEAKAEAKSESKTETKPEAKKKEPAS
jgi:putative FmdB family regulatory protein